LSSSFASAPSTTGGAAFACPAPVIESERGIAVAVPDVASARRQIDVGRLGDREGRAHVAGDEQVVEELLDDAGVAPHAVGEDAPRLGVVGAARQLVGHAAQRRHRRAQRVTDDVDHPPPDRVKLRFRPHQREP